MSLVSLNTNPPHVSHGAALSLDESHDMAAMNALKSLSEIGYAPNTPKSEQLTAGAGGDG